MKGIFSEECNRTACSNKNAIFYNYSTQKFYCEKCAFRINQVNPEAQKLFGHQLCINVSQLKIIITDLYPMFKGIKEMDIMNASDFSIFCHGMLSGGISMHIRNLYKLWDTKSPYHTYFKKEYKINQPDEMSGVITYAIWLKHRNLL